MKNAKRSADEKRILELSPLMTVPEVALYLRATPSWVRKLIAAAELPYQPQGKAFLVLRRDVDAYIEACRARHHSPKVVQTTS